MDKGQRSSVSDDQDHSTCQCTIPLQRLALCSLLIPQAIAASRCSSPSGAYVDCGTTRIYVSCLDTPLRIYTENHTPAATPSPFSDHPISSRILLTPTTPRTSRTGSSAAQMASATCSTWIGGIVSAFATDSRGDEVPVARERRMREGVGRCAGAAECSDADRSRSAAMGEVSGRWCGWYTRPVTTPMSRVCVG